MIIPVNSYVVIEKIKKDKTESGFLLTSDDSNMVCEGIVVARDKYICANMKSLCAGDKIIFLKHKGITVKDCDEKEYIMIKTEDIIGLIKGNEGDCE